MRSMQDTLCTMPAKNGKIKNKSSAANEESRKDHQTPFNKN